MQKPVSSYLISRFIDFLNDLPDFNHSFQHYRWIGFCVIVYNLDESYLSYLISLHRSWKSFLHSPPNMVLLFGIAQPPLPWSNSSYASGSSPSHSSLPHVPFNVSPHQSLRTRSENMLLFYVCSPFCLWLSPPTHPPTTTPSRSYTESTGCILRFLECFPHSC